MANRSDLSALIDSARINPMAVQKAGISFLEKVRNGEVEIVDASNAFVYMGEFAATLFTNSIRRNELSMSRQYPELANTRKDLYHHMSNIDYVNTFSTPSVATISFNFNKEELISKAVPTGVAGIKKLVIGRNTQIMVGTIPFTLQYPIEIRVLSHGGLQIVYDNSRPSPLQLLESNNVTWSTENYNTGHTDYIRIDVPVNQMELKSYTAPLMASKVFDKTYAYTDTFYHCRVYASNAAGGWDEIGTTHSDQVFDPLTPTAMLQVLDGGQLNVSIPQVYYSTGLVTRTLRIDIFTTKGVLELALGTYGADMFLPTWRDLDKDDNGKYTAPIAQMVDGFIVSTSSATGGSNEISFEKLKARVIANALGPIDVPITNVQIQSQLDRLTDAGFSGVVVVDNATKRLYIATRELPAPDIAEISTGIGSNVVTLMKTAAEILTTADVADNGTRITILPTTLYKNEGGYLSIVSPEQRTELLSYEGDSRVERVTEGNFLYSPFHYVYDFTDNVFTVRPYYFGDPLISRKFFVDDNGTLGVGISNGSHDFRRTDTGWSLRVMTSSTDSLKALDDDSVVAQLAFVPVGEIGRCYLNGTLVGRDTVTKEWIFEFAFDTSWDVDPANSIYLNGFAVDGIEPHPYPATLSTVFDVFFAVEEDVLVEGGDTGDIDLVMGKWLIDRSVIGLYHEQLTLTLGSELSGLWVPARSTIGEESYARYEANIPKYYTADVPKKDENGALVLEKDGNGVLRMVYEHRAGDPELNADGSPVWLHEKGQIMYQDGQPIVVSPRTITRQVDLCVFDGVYYFATATTDTDYKATVPTQIVEWVNVTLAPIRKKVLEQTELRFHPKATIGRVDVVVDSSEKTSMEAAQGLTITYYVTDKVYRDEALKTEIRKSTRRVITAALAAQGITRDNIEQQLKSTMGDDVIGVDMEGLGGTANYRVVSMMDDSARLCIGKKLTYLPNKTYSVEDNIDTLFVRHAAE